MAVAFFVLKSSLNSTTWAHCLSETVLRYWEFSVYKNKSKNVSYTSLSWLCLGMSPCAWVCRPVSGYVTLCLGMSHHAWACYHMPGSVTLFLGMSPFINGPVTMCLNMSAFKWDCHPTRGHVILCMDMSLCDQTRHVSLCANHKLICIVQCLVLLQYYRRGKVTWPYKVVLH